MKTNHSKHIKKLLKYANLDTLIKYAPEGNFPPKIVIAILAEYRRRTTAGKFLLKQSHFDEILKIIAPICDQLNEKKLRKILSLFKEIEFLYNNIESLYREPENVYWDAIFKQCEADGEKEYLEKLKTMGEIAEDD
jgi:hypothetical protein